MAEQSKEQGFFVLAVLMMAMALSAMLWVAVDAWYVVMNQNKTALRQLQNASATLHVSIAEGKAVVRPGLEDGR